MRRNAPSNSHPQHLRTLDEFPPFSWVHRQEVGGECLTLRVSQSPQQGLAGRATTAVAQRHTGHSIQAQAH